MSKTRSVLGKGLSALIPNARLEDRSSFVDRSSNEERISGIELAENLPELGARRHENFSGRQEPSIKGIEIAKIAPNPLQPRKEFPAGSLEELTQSIREHGVVQAVTVRRVASDRYELISGERRIRAAIEAGLTEIPAFIIEVETDRKMLELAIVENVQRLQLNPIDEAEAYQRLVEDCGLTQEEVAEKISKDRTTVANFIRLLRLPEPIKDSLRAGELGLGHAKAILSVVDHARQIALWQEAVRNQYSVRKLEELTRAASNPAKTSRSKTGKQRDASPTAGTNGYETSSDLRAIEGTFQQILGTQVKVRVKPDNTGEVAIQFYSFDDLERIQELLSTVKEA